MPEFSYDEAFLRNVGIFSAELQDLLKRSCVAIAGVGGVGGITAVTLARNGLGRLKLADPEVFDVSNLNRQYGSMESTIGKNKAIVTGGIIKDISPFCSLDIFSKGTNKENIDDFLDCADVVIDAIEYNAPREKLRLYEKSRERGLFVLSGPIVGLGALIMCFDPKGVQMEEIFCFPKDPSLIDSHKIPLPRIAGCDIDYVSDLFFEQLLRKVGPYASTNCASADLSGGFVSMDAIKVIMRKERKRDSSAFPYLEEIPLSVIPKARRVDLWAQYKDGVIDMLNF